MTTHIGTQNTITRGNGAAGFDSAPLSNTLSPKDFIGRINRAWGKTVDAIIDTGRHLLAARTALSSLDYKQVLKQLTCGASVAKKVVRIVEHPTLSSPENSGRLPPHFTILYILSQIDVEPVEAAIADGTIYPRMSRKEAIALKKAFESGNDDETPSEDNNETPSEDNNEAPSAPAPLDPKTTFTEVWDRLAETKEGCEAIAAKFDQVGRAGLCTMMSKELNADIVDHIVNHAVRSEEIAANSVLGRKIKAASKNSKYAVDATNKLHTALWIAKQDKLDDDLVSKLHGAVKFIALAAERRNIAFDDVVIATGKPKRRN